MLKRILVRLNIKYLLFSLIVIYTFYFFGAFTHFLEKDYYQNFQYPLEGDVLRYAHQLRNNKNPDIKPINIFNYTFIKDSNIKCIEEGTTINPKLVILVKSALKNFDKRMAIRKSWGFEKRFSDITIRTIFLLGNIDNNNIELQKYINLEAEQFNDIVQADFIDYYFNNTIKTMMGFKWAIKYCPLSDFYMFVDDDYYVSIKNVLRFLRNPLKYPEYLEEADEALRKLAHKLSRSDLKNQYVKENLLLEAKNILMAGINSFDNKKHFHRLEDFVVKEYDISEMNAKRPKRSLLNYKSISDTKLFAGFVFKSSPHRHKSSKWYISLNEYPYNMWPPYITAGAFILSREALYEMYYVSLYTKYFRFDDIYLGLVALKANIELLHCEEFHYYKATYSGPHSYRYVIASHGYDNSKDMLRIWTETRAAGHA